MPVRTCIPPLLKILVIIGFGGIFSIVEKSRNQWDYLVFTQMWPQTSCIQINETRGAGKCIMPKDVQDWTIHGLWPSVNDGTDPSYCNDSWPFCPDRIKDLLPLMEIHWPNLVADEAVTSFWQHEWVKHGTCAASLPALDSEHLYFASSLDLQNRFNITSALASAGIFPSTNTLYKLDDIRKAIELQTGQHTNILCMEGKVQKEQLLGEVEICMDKEMKPIDCKSSGFHISHYRSSRRFGRPFFRNPKWDWYPYFPEFLDCANDLPIRYPVIQPCRKSLN